MTEETPYGRYGYPSPGEAKGSWNETPERIWAQQEIEIADEVETWENLPDPDPDAVTDDGQRRVYRIVEDKVFARDDGASWTIIGGTGSPERPLPDVHAGSVSTDEGRITGDEDITISVPGDASTLPDAINAAAEYIEQRPETNITVNIESGHTVTEQVSIRQRNLQNITVTADDETVPVETDGWVGRNSDRGSAPLFHFTNGSKSPLIDAVFSWGSGDTDSSGLLVTFGARAVLSQGAGLIGFRDGIIANETGTAHAFRADLSDQDRYGVHARHLSDVNCSEADLTGCGDTGVYARRVSRIDARAAELDNCHRAAWSEHVSLIELDGATATNCSSWPFIVGYSGSINARSVDVTGSELSIDVRDGGYISLEEVTGLDAVGVNIDSGGSANVEGEKTYGSTIYQQLQDQNDTAFGNDALDGYNGSSVTGFGRMAGDSSEGNNLALVGTLSGWQLDGNDVAAIGNEAGRENTGSLSSFVGNRAGRENTGTRVTAVGNNAARDNSGNGVIALGRDAARGNTESDVMLITDQDGNLQAKMDLANGNLEINGEITENANL